MKIRRIVSVVMAAIAVWGFIACSSDPEEVVEEPVVWNHGDGVTSVDLQTQKFDYPPTKEVWIKRDGDDLACEIANYTVSVERRRLVVDREIIGDTLNISVHEIRTNLDQNEGRLHVNIYFTMPDIPLSDYVLRLDGMLWGRMQWTENKDVLMLQDPRD